MLYDILIVTLEWLCFGARLASMMGIRESDRFAPAIPVLTGGVRPWTDIRLFPERSQTSRTTIPSQGQALASWRRDPATFLSVPVRVCRLG